MKNRQVGVVGAGIMGSGVSELLITHGFHAVLVDVSEDVLRNAQLRIRQGLRGRLLTGQRSGGETTKEILERLTVTTDYNALADAQFVIENATEETTVKRNIYPQLDQICSEDCIFIADTSCVPVSFLASLTKRPDQVIGVHFMNPAATKPTVEMIRGQDTSEKTLAVTQALMRALGRKYVVVQDSAGFVSNRVLMLMINEAIKVLEEGTAEARDIDQIFTSCFGHTMGPLATSDLIGLDTIMKSLEVLVEFTGESRFAPCSLLKSKVARGDLGRKSGRGFFEYM